MATKLPYVAQPGSIISVLNKVKQAKTPDRFTQDFLQTTLGCKGGNYAQFIPLAKKLGILNTDGSPTILYKRFRNNATSGASMAQAIKNGYHEIFSRNEAADKLDRVQLKGLVLEITGLEEGNTVVQLTCQTFDSLKKLADFKAQPGEGQTEDKEEAGKDGAGDANDEKEGKDVGLNLTYTINLVLPKTDDPAVFNAIFRSLRENLLRQ
jgi:hypothetical protein